MAQESWKFDQEDTGCQLPDGPIYCSNNCGFFGCKATRNMCSKCYRDLVLAQASASCITSVSEKAPLTTSSPHFFVERPVQVEKSSYAEPLVNVLTNKTIKEHDYYAQDLPGSSTSLPVNRCFVCNKRVGLTGFKCRCGDIFCSLHRYFDKHGCTFDYKSAGRYAISKANPVFKADKIDKI